MAYDLNFSHPSYLPNTEERIERLRQVINKRPTAIILHGTSAMELEERITELKESNICYCTVNQAQIIEENLLGKINRKFSIIMCSAPGNIREIFRFLERQEANILISKLPTFEHEGITEFIEKYDKKLLFHATTYGSETVPNKEYPLHIPLLASISVILSLVIIGGASKVVLFGADGGRISQNALYYREPQLRMEFTSSEKAIMQDTISLNARLLSVLQRVYETYNLAPVDIVNCSPQSHYTSFSKLSYNETFDLLKGDAHA